MTVIESSRRPKGETPRRRSSAGRRGARGARPARVEPRILLVGEDAEGVESALRGLAVQVQRVGSPEQAVAAIAAFDVRVIAAVVAPPVSGHALPAVVAVLRDATGPAWPIFVVVPDATPDAQSRRLYRSGATLVFEWPREALLLPRVALEMLEVEPRPSPATSEDLRLERALRARLALVPGNGRRIRVEVRGGTAFLAGEVETLWQKRRIEESAEQMPGVASVISRGLSVVPSGLEDREVARNIRALLRGASSVEDQTISVSVNDGHTVLTGTVSSQDELERLRELVRNMRGVRSLTDRTEHAPAKRKRDRAVAQQLQSMLSHLFPSADVRVAVVQGVAVLTGTVARLEAKRAIESRVSRHESIARVASKIEVSGPAGEAS